MDKIEMLLQDLTNEVREKDKFLEEINAVMWEGYIADNSSGLSVDDCAKIMLVLNNWASKY